MPDPLIGDEGMDYIAVVCSRSGAYFRPTSRQDVGIDAHIEFRNGQGDSTGAIALVQSKAGLSYITPSGKYRILANKRHFQIWSQYILPVIGIVYNPVIEDARWVNISDHLKISPASIEDGPYVIEAPAHQSFSKEAFPEFQNVIESIHLRVRSRSAQELIDRYLTGDDTNKGVSLTELFSEYRRTPLVCFFIHQAIMIETDQALSEYLVHLMGFYCSHEDRANIEEYTAPRALRDLAAKCIRGFGVPEVVKMLSAIDPETGIERGSLGQTIAFQSLAVENIVFKLRLIAKNRQLDAHVRFYAIGILVEFMGYNDHKFFRTLLKGEQDSFMVEILQWALEFF